MTSHPTVSVVIPYSPTYTPESMLEEAKETVAAQTVPTELVVVDDDGGAGPAVARNLGLDRADTRYVAFLDADDLWEPDKLERQLDRLAETGAGICVQGNPMATDEFVYRAFVGDLTAVMSSVLVDTDSVDARFEAGLERGEDLLYVLEAASEAGVCLCPELFTRRLHEGSVMASGISAEAFLKHDKRFAYLVSQRVPEAQPYLYTYYVQTFTQAGTLAHEEGDYDRAVDYYLRALRISPHPMTVWHLLRSAVRRAVT
ncbi:glycosyltransferase [Natronomonas sp. CBA1123]|uniref:glycosyltransferase n=1 Tax=Natronomonas sp. CBA1123 TaxID=2668070 RepID=UPI0012E9CF8A|nr:glycosyltransferase [Natronomonas sp. CBA1123]MUV86836.1 glycosyltransferase [Natronomonas sp. CBA1123]